MNTHNLINSSFRSELQKLADAKTVTELEDLMQGFIKFNCFSHHWEIVRECEISGIRQKFDYLGSGDLEALITFYDNSNYIGSGHRCFYDGTLNESEEILHFFRHKVA